MEKELSLLLFLVLSLYNMNKADKQYTINLVHILQEFSIIFCLENSGILNEDLIDLNDLEKSIKLNDKLFNNVLEDGDITSNLKQVKKAYNQVIGYFQIIKSHYNNVVANKRQLELLFKFKQQLEEQIDMLEALL